MVLDATRMHEYDVSIAIRKESYEATTTGDGIGYRFTLGDTVRVGTWRLRRRLRGDARERPAELTVDDVETVLDRRFEALLRELRERPNLERTLREYEAVFAELCEGTDVDTPGGR